MAKKESGTIFDKVLFIGPDVNNRGGIVAVLRAYRDNLPAFHCLSTNSGKGFIPGIINFVRTVVALPFVRLFTPYTILDVHGSGYKSWRRKRIIIAVGHALGFRIIFHIHAGALRKFTEEKGKDYILTTTNKCEKVVFLTQEWARYAREELGVKHVETLMNIVSPPAMAKIPRKQGSPLSLVYLGYLLQPKGIFDLLDVMIANQDRWRGKVTLTIGGQYNEDKIRAIIKDNGLSDMAKFLGWVKGAEKDRIMATSDVLVLPSYFEGMPICILEAMTYAIPIITTPVGGIPEIMTDGIEGTFITPGDKKALAQAIDMYLEHPELLKAQGQAGYSHSQQFLPGNITARLASIIGK